MRENLQAVFGLIVIALIAGVVLQAMGYAIGAEIITGIIKSLQWIIKQCISLINGAVK